MDIYIMDTSMQTHIHTHGTQESDCNTKIRVYTLSLHRGGGEPGEKAKAGGRRTRGKGEQRGAAHFRTICLFRKRAKVEALLPPPPPPKLEGCRVSVCRKCRQPRMVPTKPQMMNHFRTSPTTCLTSSLTPPNLMLSFVLTDFNT